MERALFGNLFLSVGAMKAGTTWLSMMLRQHPALHFTPEKELHYFYHRYVSADVLSDRQRLAKAQAQYLRRYDPDKANIAVVRARLDWVSDYLSNPVDDSWYRRLFRLGPGQIYACDFSNLNAHLPAEAWPQIAAGCDRLKVLYTMRDPLDRLWSHVRFHLQFTGQSEMLDRWKPPQLRDFARQAHIWNNGEYGRILRRLTKALPAEDRLVLFYEDIHTDPLAGLRRIEAFLGLEPHAYDPAGFARRHAASPPRAMPDGFKRSFAADTARIKAEVAALGFALPQAWS